MKGDYLRYLTEFLLESQFNEKLDLTMKCYKEAEKLALSNLPPTHPTRLGLFLNMSVFYYEII